jgi:hypothetical protein
MSLNLNLLDDYCKHIKSWTALDSRLQKHSRLKQIGADCFCRLLFTRILSAGVNRVFFESGSSIAIFAHYFRKYVQKHRTNAMFKQLTIETNNILACLEFEFFGCCPVDMYPAGPAEEKYGATFGTLDSIPPPPPPTEPGMPVPFPKKEMDPIRKHFKGKYSRHGIIFMSASGIELNHEDDGFQGPHVSSYPNMLFKRILFEVGCPIVMFMDQSKIQKGGFSKGTCFPVCDAELSWGAVCTRHPFALVFGGNAKDELDPTLKQLFDLGLMNAKIDSDDQEFGVVVSNAKFDDRFPFSR